MRLFLVCFLVACVWADGDKRYEMGPYAPPYKRGDPYDDKYINERRYKKNDYKKDEYKKDDYQKDEYVEEAYERPHDRYKEKKPYGRDRYEETPKYKEDRYENRPYQGRERNDDYKKNMYGYKYDNADRYDGEYKSMNDDDKYNGEYRGIYGGDDKYGNEYKSQYDSNDKYDGEYKKSMRGDDKYSEYKSKYGEDKYNRKDPYMPPTVYKRDDERDYLHVVLYPKYEAANSDEYDPRPQSYEKYRNTKYEDEYPKKKYDTKTLSSPVDRYEDGYVEGQHYDKDFWFWPNYGAGVNYQHRNGAWSAPGYKRPDPFHNRCFYKGRMQNGCDSYEFMSEDPTKRAYE